MRRGFFFLCYQVYPFPPSSTSILRWDKKKGKQLVHYGGWDSPLCEALHTININMIG